MPNSIEMTTSTSALRDIYKTLNGVVEQRNTIPILSAVHVNGDAFTVTDLDFEVQVKGGIAQSAKKPFAIEYGAIKRILPHVESDNVSVQIDDGIASLNFYGSQYSAASYDANDFPFLDFGKAKKSRIGNAGIIEAIKAVRFAVSDEETRYYLNGICFTENADEQAGIVATNGHILAFKPIAFMPENAKNKIMHYKAIDYLISQNARPDTCQFMDLKCRFTYPGVVFTSKLIDGTFPDWRRVVPTDAIDYFKIDRKQLVATLKRIKAFATKKWKVTVKLEQLDGELILSGGQYENKFREKLPAQFQTDELPEIGLNSQYLLQICQAFSGSDAITLSWEKGSNSSPLNVRSDNSDLHVTVMPMRVLR